MKPQSRRTRALGPLLQVRNRIDALDDAILELLAKRAQAAREVAEVKRREDLGFHDPEREQKVLDRLVARGGGTFPANAIRTVFREVMSACMSVEEPLRVAYLGPEGTFSQMAARHLFGREARYRECATIDAVFDTVKSRDATYGVVPIENSTEGAVSMTSDALLDGDLLIRREYVLPVAHCLLSRAKSLNGISAVFSHPQALAQCRLWIAKHLPGAQVVQSTSTAAAAREAAADDRVAAIGSEVAADLHDLPILQRRIQDRPENATRFVVVAREDAPPTGSDRTTLAFGVVDQKGALRKVLSVFEAFEVNLTRIESRPNRKRAWHYVFLADVEGHRSEPALAKALARLESSVDFVKVVGSYPREDTPAPLRAKAKAKAKAKTKAKTTTRRTR